jgi:beta-1,4-mannosyl-glycoprotein beta-1,4-N-acetylglucosaminyltransferase
MKIYDCFPFFCELDLLEIRLNILDPYVDYFVIRESNLGFAGNQKKYFFEENKHLFKDFLHKIIYLKVDNNPDDFYNLPYVINPQNEDEICMNKIYDFVKNSNNWEKHEKHWGREFFQRESLHRGLLKCEDDDLILFGDLDEIPNPEILEKVIKSYEYDKTYVFEQKMYYYYLNLFKEDRWRGTILTSYRFLKDKPLNDLRLQGRSSISGVYPFDVLENSGWHFSYMGGTDRVIFKIESGGHQELNTTQVKSNVRDNIENKKDIFFRGCTMQEVEIDQTYPAWLLANIHRFPQLLNNQV